MYVYDGVFMCVCRCVHVYVCESVIMCMCVGFNVFV